MAASSSTDQHLTRRAFLRKSSQVAFSAISAITLGTSLSSCAHIGLKEEAPVHYPRLSGYKIQSPEHYGLEGCMTGAWFGWWYHESYMALKSYERNVTKSLSIIFPKYQASVIPLAISNGFIGSSMVPAAERGVAPFITYDSRYGVQDRRNILNEVIGGKHDEVIIKTAKNLRQYGERYGGFFIRTMREMNLSNTWPYAGNPSKFKKVWKHIWGIFDEEGTNEYATWVFNPYVAQGRGTASRYYPGDRHVDWIGMNGYNWENQSWGRYESFSRLFGQPYSHLRRQHPTKPIMIAETGTPETHSKPYWVRNAFKSVKEKFPGIKALCWWSEWWSHDMVSDMDSRIDSSPEALEAFRQGISDPYFLGKVPYWIGAIR